MWQTPRVYYLLSVRLHEGGPANGFGAWQLRLIQYKMVAFVCLGPCGLSKFFRGFEKERELLLFPRSLSKQVVGLFFFV